VAEYLALQQPFFKSHPDIFSLAVMVDLVIIAPVACFLIVRLKRALTWQSLFSYMALGGLVSAFLLRGTQTGKSLVAFAISLELLLLAFFTTKVVSFVNRVRTGLKAGEPLEQALRQSLEAAYGQSLAAPLLRLSLTEFFLIYYGIFGWFRRSQTSNSVRPSTFSYHRSYDTTTLLAIVVILLFEAVPLHLLVNEWSSIAAWVLTVLELYTLLWLLGDYQALRLKPIEFTATHLHLYKGLRWQTDVALSNIVEITPAEFEVPEGCLDFSLSKTPQFLLRMDKPIVVYGLFGQEREASCVSISVDDPQRFQAHLQQLFTVRSELP